MGLPDIPRAQDFHSTLDMSFAWYGDGISASPNIQKLLGNYEFAFVQENVTFCSTAGYVLGKCSSCSYPLAKLFIVCPF